ncbi:MAG: D-TA family PLP-dependent enzyme [Acidimicrobiaceae bacterium]|nr:D-TA family PLP-dependent enzyme [Acidimicrobiaceae bacterium]
MDLDTPALVIDLDRVESNVASMASLARASGVRLRPHTKTHKMPEIARLQIEAGAAGLTCAKLGEAEVMVEAGFDDILIAFPLLGADKLARLEVLRRTARIQVSLDSVEVATGLAELGVRSGQPVEVYVEVDTGQHRMGTAPGAPTIDLVSRLVETPGLVVVGLLSHAGHSYPISDHAQRSALVDDELRELLATQLALAKLGIDVREISVGSTPTVRDEMSRRGVSEVRPGTYVFNDTLMLAHGVATLETCAAHVIATVVSRPSPERFVLDAGSKCLTSDGVGRPGWIQVAGRDELTIEFVNEEHGVGRIDLSRGVPLSIGDKVLLIPSHVCPVINLFERAVATRGDLVVGALDVTGRGRVR